MHRHLVGVVTAAMCPLLLAFLIPLVVLVNRDAEHRAIDSASNRAAAIAAVAATLNERSVPDVPVDGFAATVFLPDGRLLGYRAERTPAVRVAAGCVPATNEVADGVEVLRPVGDPAGGPADCRTVVRVLATAEALRGNSTPITVLVVALSLALLLLGILLADRLARGLLRSVRELADVADRMAAGDLNARVLPGGPSEIRRVGNQLNQLALRVDRLLDDQRQRAADLAHRLRTPLTSLRLDIDALPDEEASWRLVHDHEVVTRALDDVIHSARRAAADGADARADVVRVVSDRVEFWSVLAEDTGRSIACDLPAHPLPVRVGPAALAATIDALLGNVFAHTPEGVPIRLGVRPSGADAVLTIDDDGPGFPDPSVIRRGRSTGASTGLGLDIARRTAAESGGGIRLGASPTGGARVELLLGGAADRAALEPRSYRWLNP